MANKIIPTKVRIDGKWYNTREGWAGKLELEESGKVYPTVEFTANEPYTHISNFYFVFDSDGNKVGEIDVKNNKCSGCVSSFEIPSNYSTEDIETSSSNSSNFTRNEETYSNSNSYEEQKTYYDDPFAETRRNAENMVGQLYAHTTAEERVKSWMEFRKRDEEEKRKKAEADRERMREFSKAEEIVRKRIEAENAEKERQSKLWKEQGLCPDCGSKRFLFFNKCKTCIAKKIVEWWKQKESEILLIFSFALLLGGTALGKVLGNSIFPVICFIIGGIMTIKRIKEHYADKSALVFSLMLIICGIASGIMLENPLPPVVCFIFGGLIKAFRKEEHYFRITFFYLVPICLSVFTVTDSGWILFFGIVSFIVWLILLIRGPW